MHQNLHQISTTQNSMSSSHPFTVVDDEDDTDICPVCDGQCTCRVQPLLNLPTAPPPSLKIKFTLPPSLIAKRRLPPNKSSSNNQQTTSASVTDAYTTPLKKRGRPPKPALHPSTPYKPTNLKSAAPLKSKKTAAKIKQKLPTFVAASALSSISSASDSSSSTSSLSDFDLDTDSDIQAEEEKFIVADIHDKARLRRELLGGDDPHLKKRSPTHHNSDWVIRPRKKSVGGSDAEQMDVDTDLTDDEAETQNGDQDDGEDDDDDDDNGEDEPDGMDGVEDEDEDTDGRHHYVGLATGWSEEDESSFDADLFFANLSDSSSNSSSSSTSTRRRCHSYTPGDIDIDTDHSSSTSESHTTRTALQSLPFEVTENWDGQLIFTNGEAESRGIVDIDFEKDAERYLIDSDADDDDASCSSSNSNFPYHRPNYVPSSTAQVPESSDIDMLSFSDADAGYEEDGGDADEGDTTDEELVGDDCLPNERAMRLFTLPMPMGMSLSAINPMSTVSPSIGVEKRRHRRNSVDGEKEERRRWRRRLRLGVGAAAAGPRAADILAGKIVFLGDESANEYASSSDSMVNADKGKGKQKASFSSSSPPSSPTKYSRQTQIPNTPRTGVFIPTGETRQVVIGDDRKGGDVPSPHPRFHRRRSSRVSVVQYLLEKHLQQSLPSGNPPPATNTTGSSPSIISEAPSPFHHFLSSAAASPLTGTEDLATANINASSGDDYDPGTPCPCPAEAEVDDDGTTCIVQLDDVLEASFLDDSMDRECEAGSFLTLTSGTHLGLMEDSSTAPSAATTTTTLSTDSTTAAEASNKHLTRWDVISIGAFRQTREQQQQAWGPGSGSSNVANYGGVIKNGASAGSPLSALLWQNSGAGNAVGGGGGGAGSSKKSSSSSKPASTSTPSTSGSRSKGSSTKAAKRRRLMMTSSTMSSPLVLPLSSASLSALPSKTHSSPLSSHSQHTPTTHKNRKELRRERKLLKRTSSQSSSNHHPQPSFFSTHPHAAHTNNAGNYNNNNHHQFHTHQHHPNMKTRGTSSSQRMGFFGGAVPPLNL